MWSLRIHLPSCAPHLAAPNNWRGIKNGWKPPKRRGNEELIKPSVFVCTSVTYICITDNDGIHKKNIRGRGTGVAGTLTLSFIVVFLLLAPVVYIPSSLVSFVVLLLFIYFLSRSYTSGTCQRACVLLSHWERHKTSASFLKNANGLYLWPAPVREWVSILREVFVRSCASRTCRFVHLLNTKRLFLGCLRLCPWWLCAYVLFFFSACTTYRYWQRLSLCVRPLLVCTAAVHTSPDPSCHRTAVEGKEGTSKPTVCESVRLYW